jgi:hypothetical protein
VDSEELARRQAEMRERNKRRVSPSPSSLLKSLPEGRAAKDKGEPPKAVRKVSTLHPARQPRETDASVGHLVDRPQPLKPITLSKEMVYSPRFGLKPLSGSDRAELLLDQALAICYGGPEFLRRQSIDRYLHLIPEFKNFVFTDYCQGEPSEVRAAEVRIERLNWVMSDWVASYLNDENHPIMASYALDATQFISKIADGYRSYSDSENYPDFRIVGLVGTGEPWFESRLREFPDAAFKREFTQSSRLSGLFCLVPPGASVRLHHHEEPLLLAGDKFAVSVSRCYLSSGVQDFCNADCVEAYFPDMQEDFKFYSEVVQIDNEGHVTPIHVRLEVPGHWIMAGMSEEYEGAPGKSGYHISRVVLWE